MPETSRAQVKIIKHTFFTGHPAINNPDDPDYPFKLEVVMDPPTELLLSLVGAMAPSNTELECEERVMIGLTREAIDRAVEAQCLRTLPHVRRFTITGPEGIIEEFVNGNQATN